MGKQAAPTTALENWRRHALLVISIIMLAAGLVLSATSASSEMEFARAILLKVGIVLFMIWLAMPQLQRLNPWVVVPVGILALTAIVRPQLLLLLPKIMIPLAPVLLLIWLFCSPKKKRAREE